MRNFTRFILTITPLFLLTPVFSQTSKHVPGTPCYNCPKDNSGVSLQKGDGNSVMNGNHVCATSYSTTACGLNYVTGSVTLGRRSPVTGVAQPANVTIAGLPACYTVVKAFLYADASGNGVAVTATVKNPASVTANYPMTIIGSDIDKCWSSAGYSGTYSYRADITPAISGNGTYVLSNIPTGATNDIDGATIVIIYTDPTQNYTGSMVIADGAHVAQGGCITDMMTGWNACGASTLANSFLIIGDLQKIANTTINFNSATSNFTQLSSNDNWWNCITGTANPVTAGQTSAQFGACNSGDCYNAVAWGLYFQTNCLVCSATNLTVTATTASSCSAGSATANVSGGTGPYTYTWSPSGGNSQSITGVPTGVYTVTVKDATGCRTGSATVNVSSASGPTITAASQTMCAGGSATLTASGGISYTWSPGGSLNTTSGSVVIASPGATQIYSVSGSNASGCVATITTQVTVSPLPVIVIGSNSPVCAGNPINLTSSGGSTYSWSGPSAYSSTAQNPVIPNAQSTNAGVYTVTVTSAVGCKSTSSVNVSVTTPTTSASNTGPYCAGATIQLNAPAATSYTWSGPGGFTSNAQNPTRPASTAAMSGIYTVVATVGGCTVAATTSVTVNPLPVVSASNTGPYCPGNTIQLNTSVASSYTWTGPAGFTSGSQNPTIAGALTTNSGNYIVTIKDVNGCVNSATTNVVVNPNPTPVINSNSPVCLGSNINLTSGGGTGYSWSGPSGFSSALQNPTVPGATIANAGVYTVTVTALGCSSTATTNVVVTTPTTSAGNTGPYCAGATIQLNAPAATSYTWSGPGGFTSNAQNPTRPASTPAMSGTYTVIVTIGTCTAAATTSVTVNALPVPTTSNTGPYCPGNTIQLNGSAATSYTWSGPAGFSSNSQNPTQGGATTAMSGTYTLTVKDVNGCVNTATTSVVVNPNPTPVINSNSPVCLNTNINLTSSGGTGYSWSGPSGFTSGLQNPTVTNATIANAGVYTVTVTALGCSSTATTNVIVTTPTTSASNTGPYCAGSTIQLNAPVATSYTWTGPGGFTSNAQNPTRPASTTAMSGNYTILVTIGTCTATATTSVTVNALPTPTASNTGPYCPGNTIQLNGSSATSYTWSGPSSFASNSQNPTQAGATTAMSGVYTLTVTDVNGCKNSVTTNVTVNPNPTPVINSNSPVCLNNTINLTSGGGTGYSWSGPAGFSSALQNPTVPGATIANAGVYTVTVTALGCSSTATTNVVVTTPTTSASNTGPYCAGATIQLNAPAATSYTWSGPSGFSSNAQNPTRPASTTAMSGNYTILVTIGTCTATATTSVTVNALPTPTATSNSPVCVNKAINLLGSAAVSYTWSGPSGFSSNIQNPTIATAGSVNAGVYTYSVTDANGCKNGTTTNVVVNPLPVITVNNPTVCINQTIGLTSNGGATYAWSGPGGFSSASQNPNISNAQASMSGAYTVTVTSAAGCSNTAVANVTVFPLPTPMISSNSPVCVGGTLSLQASGGASYVWSGPGYSGTQQNPVVNNVSMGASGVYSLLATAGSCTAMTTASITINPLPTPVINSNSPVCIGQPITFTGNGGTIYTWSGPGGFSSSSQSATIAASAMSNAGTYTLTVTNANNCTNSTTQNVVVNPQPVVSASGSTVCQNANATLGATGGVSYTWSGPGGYTSNSQNALVSSAGMSSAGQYTVLVTNANSCTNTAVATLVVNPAPTPNIVTNSPVCVNSVLSLSGSGGVSYNWTGPNGFISSAQNPTVLATSTAFTGTYNVTVTDGNGCSATASAGATVSPIPNIAIMATANMGCPPLCITFTTTSSTQLQGYSWNMGNGESYTSPVAQSCYNATGIYTVNSTITDVNGCSNAATYTVQVYPHPVADFNYAPIKPLETVDVVEFTDASYGSPVVSWNWYFMANAQYTSVQQNPEFIYQEAGDYAVALVVKSAAGCTDTVVKNIQVGEDFGIYVPNAFSPNGDGLNDLFYAKGFGVKKFEMIIFDRWGEKMFISDDIRDAWDGTYQHRGGDIVQEGVYTWMIKVTNVFGKSKEMTGHVTLIK